MPHGQRISDSARDLIRRLLEPDPESRLTLREVRAHSWTTDAVAPQKDYEAEVERRLCEVNRFNAVAREQKLEQKLQAAFKQEQTARSGFLTPKSHLPMDVDPSIPSLDDADPLPSSSANASSAPPESPPRSQRALASRADRSPKHRLEWPNSPCDGKVVQSSASPLKLARVGDLTFGKCRELSASGQRLAAPAAEPKEKEDTATATRQRTSAKESKTMKPRSRVKEPASAVQQSHGHFSSRLRSRNRLTLPALSPASRAKSAAPEVVRKPAAKKKRLAKTAIGQRHTQKRGSDS